MRPTLSSYKKSKRGSRYRVKGQDQGSRSVYSPQQIYQFSVNQCLFDVFTLMRPSIFSQKGGGGPCYRCHIYSRLECTSIHQSCYEVTRYQRDKPKCSTFYGFPWYYLDLFNRKEIELTYFSTVLLLFLSSNLTIRRIFEKNVFH